jgi:hypothetical protein
MGSRPFGRTGISDFCRLPQSGVVGGRGRIVSHPEIGPQHQGLLRTSCATCRQGSCFIPLPSQFPLALHALCEWGASRAANLIFCLKRVAASAPCLVHQPPLHWVVSSELSRQKALYIR